MKRKSVLKALQIAIMAVWSASSVLALYFVINYEGQHDNIILFMIAYVVPALGGLRLMEWFDDQIDKA